MESLLNSGAAFYGVKLDTADPYLERNLARLEIQFAERYHASVEKEQKRREQGKSPHKTIMQSMEENRLRLEVVRALRRKIAGCKDVL